jgi:hypothetical protein
MVAGSKSGPSRALNQHLLASIVLFGAFLIWAVASLRRCGAAERPELNIRPVPSYAYGDCNHRAVGLILFVPATGG